MIMVTMKHTWCDEIVRPFTHLQAQLQIDTLCTDEADVANEGIAVGAPVRPQLYKQDTALKE